LRVLLRLLMLPLLLRVLLRLLMLPLLLRVLLRLLMLPLLLRLSMLLLLRVLLWLALLMLLLLRVLLWLALLVLLLRLAFLFALSLCIGGSDSDQQTQNSCAGDSNYFHKGYLVYGWLCSLAANAAAANFLWSRRPSRRSMWVDAFSLLKLCFLRLASPSNVDI
jgi:hypothetical protein